LSSVLAGPKSSILNTGPHGLSEIVYAFTSAANNNGSAFGGLTGNTDWYNTTLGLTMLFGRFFLIVPVLAIAGSLARKQSIPATAGTFPTNTPLFFVLLLVVVVVVVGLTYFPVVSLGPILEQLTL
jgi:K+-transporting ATPase ATPase A chain